MMMSVEHLLFVSFSTQEKLGGRELKTDFERSPENVHAIVS
jgi:hypothetical protein